MSNKRISLLLFMILCMFNISAQEILKKNYLRENFTQFTDRFYTDSLFQMSRIQFPLKGLYNIEVPITTKNPLGDSIISTWKKKDWKMLTNTYFPKNKDTITIENIIYIRKTQIKGNTVVVKTYIPNSGFAISEKYALKKGKWYMIYFSSLSY